MKVVVQRVTEASVSVNHQIVGEIKKGLVVLVSFKSGEDAKNIDYIINKLINLRIFDDENGIMNLSVKDVGGSILSISQFTLYADTSKGNRPSYINALNGEEASLLYEEFNQKLRKEIAVETGVFKADMKVSLINDGPVTIIIER